MNRDPFKEYLKQTEPGKRYRGYAWHTAIGLQAVDGLKPSSYLLETAIKNIVDEYAKTTLNKVYGKVIVVHTDNQPMAQMLADALTEKYGVFFASKELSSDNAVGIAVMTDFILNS